MTLKEARRITRGLVSRVEKEIVFDCIIWDSEKKEMCSTQLVAANEKELLQYSRHIVEYHPIETRKIMYAMPADTFRTYATQTIEIESED